MGVMDLLDDPSMIAFFTLCINRWRTDRYVKQAIGATVFAGSSAGTILRLDKSRPESSKQLDYGYAIDVKHNHGDD
jgi:hypothetical protein